MKNILRSIGLAFVYLFHPKVFWIVLIPPFFALILISILGYFSFEPLREYIQGSDWLSRWIAQISQGWINWSSEDLHWLTIGLFLALFLMIGIPLILILSLTLTSVLAQPLILRLLSTEYPQLQKNGVGFRASLANALKITLAYGALWFLTLPLWIVPGLAFFIPILLNTFLHYKLFTFDSLADHASQDEINELLKTRKEVFLFLGLFCSLMLMVPLFFVIAPVFASLAFVRLSFLELTEFRSQHARVMHSE
jgi:hypothetical protein